MPSEFDFWIGEWDVAWDGGSGTNVVTSELDGAAILERFDGRPGTDLRGISVTGHDGVEWRQTWMDSERACLDFRGGIGPDGIMELRHDRYEAGAKLSFRMRFTCVTADSLVWLWQRRERTGDWSEQWRIEYRRR